MESQSSEETQEVSRTVAAPGKYLGFGLGEERFALPILKVQEILCPTRVTRVPKSLSYLKGVMNLRGKIVPIVDLRLRIGKEEQPYDSRTCFVVVRSNWNGVEMSVGLVADRVREVLLLTEGHIQHPNEASTNMEKITQCSEFISGIAIYDSKVNFLLDIDAMLAETILSQVEA